MRGTKRRTFLTAGGLVLPGISCLADALLAQDTEAAKGPVPRDVADFWVNRVGLPPNSIAGIATPSSATTRTGYRGHPAQSMAEAYGQEPLFLYADPEENRLVAANEVPAAKLLQSGDAAVELRVTRVRLNADDQERLERFESAGIYVDIQQPQSSEMASAMALAMLGALFPHKPMPAAAKLAAPPAEPGAAQTIGLPDGTGAATFCCFLKDRKRSPFGKFANALLELGGAAAVDFLPLLGMPGLMPPALKIVRTLVFNLQAHGEQDWLYQNAAIPLACTMEGAANSAAVRLRTGNYIVIPKGQSAALKGSQTGVKVSDGFLVPKTAGVLDVYDAAPETAKGVSYLSLAVTVKKTKLNRCTVTI